LTGACHQVECLPRGEAALDRLAERSFDVVLLDIRMPGLGGLETLKRIREADWPCEVVILTGQPDYDDCVAAMKYGALHYLGESGTGKGLLARTIHSLSGRCAKPFVDLHCGAVADQLLESELFGHERGAFTGAVGEKPGLFELADGGTLFLDEFAEMSPEMQSKLLKVLDHGELRLHLDRKSTRLNSSHDQISYAVFCLKKKKK